MVASNRSSHVDNPRHDGFARDEAVERHGLDRSNELEGDIRNDDIEIVVAQIKRLARSASLEFALRVGAVIIHHFYDGNADAWRSRGPKTASFRRLAQHPDLPLSAGALYRCVALFELCDRLSAPSRWEHLGASHLRLVLGLPSETQEKLLALANANRWTVKSLQGEVQRERVARLTQGGRRAEAPLSKSLKSVRKCIDSHREVVESIELLTAEDLEQSMRLLEETRMSLEVLSSSLQAAFQALDAGASRNSAPLDVNDRET